MQPTALAKFIGTVMVLDLINGQQMTTRIAEVNVIDRTVTITKPRMFVPVPDQRNPNNIQIMMVEYGQPLYKADDRVTLDLSHILMVFKPSDQQAETYVQRTSSLTAAPADFMNQLKGLDMSKLRL